MEAESEGDVMVQLTGHNLHYSYTPDRMILKDICFRFKSGEIVSTGIGYQKA